MWWPRIIALNGVAGVIDLLYTVEGAYFVPAIYDKGLSIIYGSMLLASVPYWVFCFRVILGLLVTSVSVAGGNIDLLY